MSSVFIRKLEHGSDLSLEDKAVLENVVSSPRIMPAREDIVREGERPAGVCLVLGGIAFRYKMLENGSRQIMALLIPGDFCDLHGAILGEMDHGVATLTTCTLVFIPPERVEELLRNHRIARALWWATLVDEAVLREWLVNMGRRAAEQRTAHLICELLHRFRAVAASEDDHLKLAMTQEDVADTLGLSAVHVNRTLTTLRRKGLLVWERGVVRSPDWSGLCQFAGFRPDYLHLNERGDQHGRGASAEA